LRRRRATTSPNCNGKLLPHPLDKPSRPPKDMYAVYRVPGWRVSLSIKHAILGLLAGGPLHGYDLKAAYESDLVPAARLNYGQVYTTLDRLHRDGLVVPEVVSQSERPD